MPLNSESLEIMLEESDLGLSARRLWEHTELGQKNVFHRPISSRPELNDARHYIDVISPTANAYELIGYTLFEALSGQPDWAFGDIARNVYSEGQATAPVREFIRVVEDHLQLCASRKGVRNQHQPFLPRAQDTDAFGVPFLYSALQRRLHAMTGARATAMQWKGTIENFRQKGLRVEELQRSNILQKLEVFDPNEGKPSGAELADCCDFSALTLSVIPVVEEAQRQVWFSSAPSGKLKRAQKLPKAQAGQRRTIIGFDRVLGYRIEQVEHDALWGIERHWQLATLDGKIIASELGQTLFSSKEKAVALASLHARQHYPKRVALGHWSHIAWGGGKDYREWLITLPYYLASFFSSHFAIRNVLAHVRCDVRDGPDGERVLMLQEVQSDWAQSARTAIRDGVMDPDDSDVPPFLKEWPALAMKLMLLYAAHHGLDAVAWTRGEHQVRRYDGLGVTGLKELYDHTLPREVNRMMKPFGLTCEVLGVFVPTNFSIRQSENGYEVLSAKGELLAVEQTLEDARQYVPDGGHELLYEVHGVKLPIAARKAILQTGFPAWG